MKSEEVIRKYKRELELEIPDQINNEEEKQYSVFISGLVFLLQWVLED